ncbi:ATP-binding protein [Streptomyces sp. NPDC001139]
MTDGGRESGMWEREVECAAVADALKAAAQGQGGMLLVEGPAGIGKSRLLADARAQANQEGVRVTVARAGELERDFAFGIVRQLFEPLFATGPDTNDGNGLWAGPAAQARPVFESADRPTWPAGDFAVLHGLYWLAANASEQRPLLLVVDDLQWCDVPSLRFLAYLLPRLDDLHLLLACARRTGEASADERLLAQLTTDPAVHLMQPAPLSEQTCTRLLAQILTSAVDEAFAAACHQATGGNPLLLHTLARTLADEHLTPSAANVDRVTDLGAHAVGRLTAARMARLPKTAHALARAVAVLGNRAALATAAALAGQDTTTALQSATELKRLEILRIRGAADAGTLWLSFVHPLVRAAVDGTLELAEQAQWHQHAARLLAASGAEPERVAAHLLRVPPGGDPETVAALRQAAVSAVGRGAPTGAYTYLRRALDEPPDETRHLAVLAEAGEAALLVDLEAAARHLQQAYDRFTAPARKADTATLLGSAYVYLMDTDRGLAIWSRALAQLPAALGAACSVGGLRVTDAQHSQAEDGDDGHLPACARRPSGVSAYWRSVGAHVRADKGHVILQLMVDFPASQLCWGRALTVDQPMDLNSPSREGSSGQMCADSWTPDCAGGCAAGRRGGRCRRSREWYGWRLHQGDP